MAESPQRPTRKIRWWPGLVAIILATLAMAWVRFHAEWHYQSRNLVTLVIGSGTVFWLAIWWTFFSRTRLKLRFGVLAGALCLHLVLIGLFRVRGVSGDLMPIIEFRWTTHALPAVALTTTPTNSRAAVQRTDSAQDFPQYLGPNRDGILPGPALETNWTAHPPTVLWRQKTGPAWSGFAIVGNICLTQEQRGDDECVVAYELLTGRQLWVHADVAHYNTTIAGEGPRAVPTVQSNRVFTSGGTGILNCLDLATGQVIWKQDVMVLAGATVPAWGYASAPLLADGLVIVHGGEHAGRSLYAFRSEDGKLAWSAGDRGSYASPVLATLAGVPQVLAFNEKSISGHDPSTGTIFWEKPWTSGNVVCSSPVVVGTNRVIFSSGYGFGSELLEISRDTNSVVSAQLIWKSNRLKSKFGHLFVRDGCLYGLDDGVFACVDLKEGSLHWKEGRYGHGQGLLVGDLYLLMSESGDLVLLRPKSEGPNEIGRFHLFDAKTWNPLALSGDLLLVRNDQEAVCLRLPLGQHE